MLSKSSLTEYVSVNFIISIQYGANYQIQVKEMHKTYDILEELRKIYSSGDMWYTAVTEYRELYIQLQADEWEPTYWLLKNASDFKYTITEGNENLT